MNANTAAVPKVPDDIYADKMKYKPKKTEFLKAINTETLISGELQGRLQLRLNQRLQIRSACPVPFQVYPSLSKHFPWAFH